MVQMLSSEEDEWCFKLFGILQIQIMQRTHYQLGFSGQNVFPKALYFS
jgi:hypothetical protein